MNFDQYVAARYGRLIEHAVLLGCAEGEAGTYVDRVLLEQRKRISRAEDPDPLVRRRSNARSAAPRSGPAHRPAGRARAGGGGGGGGCALAYRTVAGADAVAVRSRWGPGATAARGRGVRRDVRPARSCEPPGLVVGSDPPSGGPVRKGATVTVRTSVLSGSQCEPARTRGALAAWQFVQVRAGRPGAAVRRRGGLLVSGSCRGRLIGCRCGRSPTLGRGFDLIAEAARQTRPTESGMSLLRAT